MEPVALGDRIRELRIESKISLRKLAELVGKSPPFISDVELSRRFPSDPVLQRIAQVLQVEFQDLKKLDARESVSILKQLAQKDPGWGFALRTTAEQATKGKLSAEELIRKLNSPSADTQDDDTGR